MVHIQGCLKVCGYMQLAGWSRIEQLGISFGSVFLLFPMKVTRGHVHAVKVSFHQKSSQSSDSDLFFQVDNRFSCVILYPQKHTVCINLHVRVRLLTPYQFINIKTVLFYY